MCLIYAGRHYDNRNGKKTNTLQMLAPFIIIIITMIIITSNGSGSSSSSTMQINGISIKLHDVQLQLTKLGVDKFAALGKVEANSDITGNTQTLPKDMYAVTT
jgi:hypothetical protein